jgi:hypothetical protein
MLFLGAGIVFGPPAQEYFAKHVQVSRPLTITSFMRQTLDRNGHPIFQEHRQQKMVSWDLIYFTTRAFFDSLESSYCKLPPKNDSHGNASYLYSHKVTNVKEGNGGLLNIEFEDQGGEKGEDEADMVIAADGPSSTIRGLVCPEVERRYVGYVAWRGTLLESEATEELKDTFVDNFTFFHGPGIQILA